MASIRPQTGPNFFLNSTTVVLSQQLKIGLTALDCLLAITIIVHSSFPITACLRSQDFQRSYNKLVFSLSLANLLSGLFLFYHGVAYWATELNVYSDKFFCLGQIFVFYFGFFIQICSSFFLALDRCLTLRFPVHVKIISNRLSDVLTALLWLYSLVMAVLPMVWLNVWQSPVPCYHQPVLHKAYVYLLLAHLLVFLVFVVISTILIDRYMKLNLQTILQLYYGDVDADKYTGYLRRTGKMAAVLTILLFIFYFPYVIVLSLIAGNLNLPNLYLVQLILFYICFLYPIIAPLIVMLFDPFLREGAESLLLGMASRKNTPSINNVLTQKNPNYNSKSFSKIFAKKVTALSQLNPNDSPHPVPLQGIFW